MWSSTRWRAEVTLAAAVLLAMTVPALASSSAPDLSAPSPGQQGQPPRVHPQLPGSRLQGQATMRYWGMRVYQARLWTLPDFRADKATEHPLALELHYLLDLSGSAIAERSLEEMRRAGSMGPAQGERWLAAMQRMFPDVKAGERLTGVHQPGSGVSFWHNGRSIGNVPDPEFARLFFGIWLAPTTSEPQMRLSLLGLDDSRTR